MTAEPQPPRVREGRGAGRRGRRVCEEAGEVGVGAASAGLLVVVFPVYGGFSTVDLLEGSGGLLLWL
jgi:hypothetical protein